MPFRRVYPVFLDIGRRPVLIVGGGAVALRKARGLLEGGAWLTVVSPQFSAEWNPLGAVERIVAPYAAAHMKRKPWRLVFAATDRPEVNARVQTHAAAAGIWCCRCDLPEAGDFAGGATRRVRAYTHDHPHASKRQAPAEVVIAVSSSGASPGLAARICREMAGGIDPVLVALVDLTGRWRAAIKSQIAQGPLRRELLEWISGQEIEAVLRAAGEAAAEATFRRRLSEIQATAAKAPGPPDHRLKAPPQLRRRATRAIRHADK